MNDLVSKQAAYDTLTEYYHQRTETQHEALREALSRVPTIDAVPVVRCKDCKWWTTLPPRKWAVRDTEGRFTGKYEMIQTSFCNYGVAEEDPYNFTENDFCSRGERKN